VGLTFGTPLTRAVGTATRLVPRGSSLLADMML